MRMAEMPLSPQSTMCFGQSLASTTAIVYCSRDSKGKINPKMGRRQRTSSNSREKGRGGPDASHPRPNLRAPLLLQLRAIPSNIGHSPSGRPLFLDTPGALLEGLRCFTAFGPPCWRNSEISEINCCQRVCADAGVSLLLWLSGFDI